MGISVSQLSVAFDLKPNERIARAKYALYKDAPFYAYIIQHMVTKEDSKLVPTMGVDKRGHLYYNNDFVTKITHTQLCGVIIHEALHVAFLHCHRAPRKKGEFFHERVWNWATDIVINYIVLVSGYDLPEGLVPKVTRKDGKIVGVEKRFTVDLKVKLPNGTEISKGQIVIEDIDNKCAEQVYEELMAQLPEDDGSGGQGNVNPNGSDIIEGEGAGEGQKDGEGNEMAGGIEGIGGEEVDWKRVLAEAEAMAKSQGKMPLGMGREIADVRKSRIPWRALLRKEVASTIPYDLTYNRPNRNFLPLGIYMPSSYGERVSVIVSLDTSGSMTAEEMGHAVSEVIGIAQSYPGTDFRILTWDAEVQDDILIRSSSIHQIKRLRPKGGGGSIMRSVDEYLKKHKRYNAKLHVAFTDGMVDYSDKAPMPTLIVLVGRHVPKDHVPKWAKVVTMAS